MSKYESNKFISPIDENIEVQALINFLATAGGSVDGAPIKRIAATQPKLKEGNGQLPMLSVDESDGIAGGEGFVSIEVATNETERQSKLENAAQPPEPLMVPLLIVADAAAEADEDVAASEEDEEEPDPCEKVKIESSSLTPQRRTDLTNLQTLIVQQLSRGGSDLERSLATLIIEENRGTLRDSSGEVKHRLGIPCFGVATQTGLELLVKRLESERVSRCLEALANAKLPIPAKCPLELPFYREGDLRDKPISSELLLQQATQNRLKFSLNVKPEKLPSDQDIRRLESALDWCTDAEDSIEKIQLDRTREVIRREITERGLPKSWTTETKEQCAAAMFAVQSIAEAESLAKALDHLLRNSESAEGNKQLRELLSSAKLPTCMTIKRVDNSAQAAIEGVSFDMPKSLELQSPEFRNALRELRQWTEQVKEPVEQMLKVSAKARRNPEQSFSWLDVPYPNGWARRIEESGKPKYEVTQSEGPPEGKGWKPFNLIEARCEVEHVVAKDTGDLKAVRLQGSTRFCEVPWYGFYDLIRSQAPGTSIAHGDNRWYKPTEWVCVKEESGHMKLLQAKDVKSFMDRQKSWHWLCKGTAIAMDASMVLGVGEILQGARLLKASSTAARTAEALKVGQQLTKSAEVAAKLSASLDNPALLKLAQQGLAAQGNAGIQAGVRHTILGSTQFLHSAGAREIPLLDRLGTIRSWIFNFDIAKSTLYDLPAGALFASQPKTAEILGSLIRQTAPPATRIIESLGQTGFAATQVPLIIEVGASILSKQKAIASRGTPDWIIEAQRSLSQGGDGRELKESTERSSYAQSRRTAEQIISDIAKLMDEQKLSQNERERFNKALEKLKPLLLTPVDAAGRVDADKLPLWKAARLKFVREELAPLLLASPEQIAAAEKSRALKCTSAEEALAKGPISESELQTLDARGQLTETSRAARQLAQVLLLCVARGSDGKFDLCENNDPKHDKVTLIKREVEVPRWTASKMFPRVEDKPDDFQITFPAEGRTREPLTQTITLADVMLELERSCIAKDHPIGERLIMADLLARTALPSETYASVLKNIYQDEASTDDVRKAALIRIAGVALGIRRDEMLRGQLSTSEQKACASLSVGNSSLDLRQFLKGVSHNSATKSDTRALASSLATFVSRSAFDAGDVKRLDGLLKDPKSYTRESFQDEMLAAANKAPKTLAEWDRKLQSTLALLDEGTAIPLRAHVTQLQLTATLCECVSAATAGNLLQKERPLAQRLSLQALNELMAIPPGSHISRLAALAQSGADGQQKVSKLADQLLASLHSKAISRADVDNKVELLRLLPLLFTQLKQQIPPDLAPALLNKIAMSQRLVALGTQSALLDVLPETAGKEILNRRHPDMAAANQSRKFDNLAEMAKLLPHVRIAAINALGSLVDRSAFDLVGKFVLPENEPDAQVRLAALRASFALAPGGRGQAAKIVEQMRNRSRNENPEIDPAVNALAEQLCPPAEDRGVLGDARAAEKMRGNMGRAPQRADIGKLLGSPEYNKLNWKDLFVEVRKAKASSYKGPFWAGLDEIAWAPGPPTGNSSRKELSEQMDVLNRYDETFSKLLKTAYEKDDQEGLAARRLLYYIITEPAHSFKMSPSEKSDLNSTGYTSASPSLTAYLESMRYRAAACLADCCQTRGEKKPLGDAHMQELEELLLAAMKDTNTPSRIKFRLMSGIESIASQSNPTAVVDGKRSSQPIADKLVKVLEEAHTGKQAPQVMSAEESSAEMQFRCALVQRVLKFLSTANLSPDARKFLNGLSSPDINQLDPLPKRDAAVPAIIKQQARELVIDQTQRVFPIYAAMKADKSGNATASSRHSFLEEARGCATRFLIERQPSKDGGGVPVDTLAGLQAKEDDAAIKLIFSAAKGYRISDANDPVGVELLTLTDSQFPERVRLAAGLSILLCSSLREQRDAAIQFMAQTTVSGNLPGCRRDAAEALRNLSPGELLIAEESFNGIREKILLNMRASLEKDGGKRGAELDSDLLNTYLQGKRHDQSDDLKRRMVRTLSALGATESIQGGPKNLQAILHCRGALNIALGREYTDDFERPVHLDGLPDGNKIVREIESRYGNSEELASLADTFESLGRGTKFVTNRDADVYYRIGQNLRSRAFGADSKPVIEGANAYGSFLEQGLAESFERVSSRSDEEKNILRGLKIVAYQLTSKNGGDKKERQNLDDQLASNLAKVREQRRQEVSDCIDLAQRVIQNQQTVVPGMAKLHGEGSAPHVISISRLAAAHRELARSYTLQLELIPNGDARHKEAQLKVNQAQMEAERLYQTVLNVQLQKQAPRLHVFETRNRLAELYTSQNRSAECLQQLEAMVVLYKDTASPQLESAYHQQAAVHARLAKVAEQKDPAARQHHLDQLRSCLEKKQKVSEILRPGDKNAACNCSIAEAQIWLSAGRVPEAETAYLGAIEKTDPKSSAPELAQLHIALARLYTDNGEKAKGTRALSQGVRMLMEKAPMEETTLSAAALLASLHAVNGSMEQAKAVLKQYCSTLEQDNPNFSKDVVTDNFVTALWFSLSEFNSPEDRRRICQLIDNARKLGN